MRLLHHAIMLCLTGSLGGCIVSDKDLSDTYPAVFPIDSGECVPPNNSHTINIISRDNAGYTFKTKDKGGPIRFKILKMPESADVYVLMLLIGDTRRQYDLISAPDKNGGVTVYDFAPRHQWLLPDELKGIVVADRDDYTVRLKNDAKLAQLLRTIIRLKIQDDPEITKLVCRPIDKGFRKPQD